MSALDDPNGHDAPQARRDRGRYPHGGRGRSALSASRNHCIARSRGKILGKFLVEKRRRTYCLLEQSKAVEDNLDDRPQL